MEIIELYAEVRSEIDSAVIDETIYVVGGGTVPGFSFSGIVQSYNNSDIPEFGALLLVIFGVCVLLCVFYQKIVMHKTLLQWIHHLLV